MKIVPPRVLAKGCRDSQSLLTGTENASMLKSEEEGIEDQDIKPENNKHWSSYHEK